MKESGTIIKIECKTASSEIKALLNLFPVEVAFVYLEQYFINGPGWRVLKNLDTDPSLCSRIDNFIDNLYSELTKEYGHKLSQMSVNIIRDPILAALESTRYLKELSILNKRACSWSDRLKRKIGEYRFRNDLDRLRLKVDSIPLMLVKFNEEVLKLC